MLYQFKQYIEETDALCDLDSSKLEEYLINSFISPFQDISDIREIISHIFIVICDRIKNRLPFEHLIYFRILAKKYAHSKYRSAHDFHCPNEIPLCKDGRICESAREYFNSTLYKEQYKELVQTWCKEQIIIKSLLIKDYKNLKIRLLLEDNITLKELKRSLRKNLGK